MLAVVCSEIGMCFMRFKPDVAWSPLDEKDMIITRTFFDISWMLVITHLGMLNS